MSLAPWLSKNSKPRKGHLTVSVDGSHLTASCDCKTKPAHQRAPTLSRRAATLWPPSFSAPLKALSSRGKQALTITVAALSRQEQYAWTG